MLRCKKGPFNRALKPSFLTLKVKASGPLGKALGQQFIFGDLTYDPPN
jgi:hypothetical protein